VGKNTVSFNATGALCATHAVILVALVALGGASGTALAADQPKAATVSAELKKPLSEVEALLKAGKFPEALEKLRAVEAMSGKAPYDQHIINQYTAVACSKTQDVPCVAKALQGQIDDGFTTPEDNQKFTRLVAQVSFQAKDYDKAIDYGNRAIKGGSAPDEIYGVVGAAYYLKDDFKDAIQLEDAHVADVVKKGQTPRADELNVYLSSCAKAKDEACIAKALEYQVTYYPKPENWTQILSLVRPKGDVETLQTYRLMADTGAMSSGDDYLDMATTAMTRGSPGDAQHALQMGNDAGLLTGSKSTEAQKLTAEARKAAATDQTSLPRVEQDANAAATGVKNAGAGLAYLGYQQYDKAVDQLSKAVSKGGLKNEADTRLNLGISQLKSGHKDDAVKTFQSVHGSPALERLASLWVIHAKQT
jgi:tetratricopeptide (TPR) repeat protein